MCQAIPWHPRTIRIILNNSIGVAWGWWVGLRASLSSVETNVPLLCNSVQVEETHVGVNFTAIGPLSPCIEHMLCRLFVWVWTWNVIGQPASALKLPYFSTLGKNKWAHSWILWSSFPRGKQLSFSLVGLTGWFSHQLSCHKPCTVKTLCFNLWQNNTNQYDMSNIYYQ